MNDETMSPGVGPADRALGRLLKQTSGSLYHAIARCDMPMRRHITAAYLVFRGADCIEDCENPIDWKNERFQEYIALLEDRGSAEETIERWARFDWTGIPAVELLLMRPPAAFLLWDEYARIPAHLRAILAACVTEMCTGMASFLDNGSPYFIQRGKLRILRDDAAFDRYCHTVAGTVGQFLTELAIDLHDIEPCRAAAMRSLCGGFSRALQVVHIIKDFDADRSRGICYCPATWLDDQGQDPDEAVMSKHCAAWIIRHSAIALEENLAYLLAIPPAARGYRLLCSLWYLSGLHLLHAAARRNERAFAPPGVVVPLREKLSLAIKSRKSLADDETLSAYALVLLKKIRSAL